MSLLIADGARGLWLWQSALGQMTDIPCPLPCPCMPCVTRDHILCACRVQNDCRRLGRRSLRDEGGFPALPGLSAMCASRCGRYLYQLSGDADCAHVRHIGTGDLLYGRKLGVFPSDMRLSADGGTLLVAGGAGGEGFLLRAPELTDVRAFRTPGVCRSADFWRDGLVIVCAVEEDGIRTAVMTLAPGRPRPAELMRLDGQPGQVRVCPDGLTALVGTLEGLMRIHLVTGRVLWNLPQYPLCGCVQCLGGFAVCCDGLADVAAHFDLEHPWLRQELRASASAQACFF